MIGKILLAIAISFVILILIFVYCAIKLIKEIERND